MNKFINRLLRTAKKEKDLKTIESIYNGNKNDSIIKFEYAKMLIYYGRYEEARILLLELLNTWNADYAMLELGKAEQAINNIPKAREYYEALAKKKDPAGIFKLAKLEIDQNNPKRAKELLTSLLNNDKSGICKIALGNIAENEGDISKAREYYTKTINMNKTPFGKIALGKLERNIGNFDEARKFLKNAYEVDHYLSGKYELGRLEFVLGNVTESKKIFNEIIKDHNDPQAYIELGKIEASLGNYEKAKEYFLSLKDTPTERFGYYSLLTMCIKEKKYNESFNYLKEALQNKIWINSDIIVDISLNLNIFLDVDYQKYPYIYSIDLLIDYDPYLAIDHIINRHVSSNSTDFAKEVDVYKIFNEIKSNLNESTKINILSYTDVYVVPYENAGTYGQNYIKVITLPNTKNIVTMFPVFTMYEYLDDILPVEDENIKSLTNH